MSKYLVFELSETEKRKVQLKSALAGLSLNVFLKSVLNQVNDIKTTRCSCGGDTKLKIDTFRYELNISGETKDIIVLNFPQQKCSLCDQVGISTNVNYYFEKVIKSKVNQWLRDVGKIPEIIDFNELIKI